MPDAALLWAGDINVNPAGDIAFCSGDLLGQQRILRRLLTNPGDYLWHPDYGAGLGKFVGGTSDVAAVRAAIRSQVFLESFVARLPEPVILVRESIDGSMYVDIRYVDSSTNLSQVLSFSMSV